MTGYYDIVLGLIPASFVGIAGLLLAVGLTTTAAVSVASLVGVGLVGHAMFVNAPVDAPEQTETTSVARDTGMPAD